MLSNRTPRSLLRVLAALGVAAATAGMCPPAAAQHTSTGQCALVPLRDEGPFDYRIAHPRAKMAERFHFTPKVEALIVGESEVSIARDLEFMLRYVPNHHRVLAALVRLADREKTELPKGASFTVTCQFERATLFQPDDNVVRMMFARYLLSHNNTARGLHELEIARQRGAESAFTQYNVGMILFEHGDFERALQQAHIATRMGFPMTQLHDRLKEKNRWREPEANTEPVASSAAGSAASTPR